MQFHLETTDELRLLANILLQQDPVKYNEILTKLMAHDLQLDAGELEEIAELLAEKKRSSKDEIARQPKPELKMEMQRQLELLERVLDRVTEACFMS